MSDRTDFVTRIEIREPWPQHLQSNELALAVGEVYRDLKARLPNRVIKLSGALVSELIGHEAWIQEQLEAAGCSQELIAEVFDHAQAMFGVNPFEHGPDA